MPVAAIDTTVLLEYRRENGANHERAQNIVDGVDSGTLPTTRVTDYVKLETLNWLHTRGRHDFGIDTYERLDRSTGFEIVHSAQKDFTKAISLFLDRDVTFGDATIAADMGRTDIEYLYTFDTEDFGGFDCVTPLVTADNSFS